MQKVVISVLGPDRPGIIAAVTQCLFEADGNIENVAQTILQSEFSGTFIVSIPESLTVESMQTDLQQVMTPLGMRVFVKKYHPAPPLPELIDSEPFVIVTRGPDRKGLVAAITAVIASFGVNVTNLQAVFKGGDDPMRNIMIYEVDVPGAVNQQDFNSALRSRAQALALEVSIQHRDIFKAINRV